MPVSQDELDQTQNNFERMITMLGLVADINATTENESIHLCVKTDDPGRLIGRNGQTLNALQHLLNGMLLNKKKRFPKVLIDVIGHQDKRRPRRKTNSDTGTKQFSKRASDTGTNQLGQRALDAAKEVKKWGERVTLPNINNSEFEAISLALKDDQEIDVIRADDGGNKGVCNVTIQLKNT